MERGRAGAPVPAQPHPTGGRCRPPAPNTSAPAPAGSSNTSPRTRRSCSAAGWTSSRETVPPAALITDFGAVPAARRNIVWLLFLDPAVRAVYPEWESVARDALAFLRGAAGRHPDDPGIVGLVGELSVKSQQFRTWWSQHEVKEKTTGRKTFAHPMIGRLTLDYDTLLVPGTDQALIVYSAAPESPVQTAIDLLATLAADTAELASPG